MSLQELDEYFKDQPLPDEFYLHPAVKILNVRQFVDAQLIGIRAHGIKSAAYHRLIELKSKLETS
jgi:hypothetical protein